MSGRLAVEEEAEDFSEVLDEFQEKKSSYPDNWKEIYTECAKHEKFALMGKQMDTGEQRRYGLKNPKMPNLIKVYVNSQANQTLQNNYSPQVTPNGGGADVTKARYWEDCLRGQFRNGGPQTLNLMRRGQLAAGIHYSRVVIDFASSSGPEKCFKYQDEPNTYSVFPSFNVTSGTSCTFADMTDFLAREEISKADWKARTGEEWTFGTEKKRSVWYFWRKKSEQTDIEYLMQDSTLDYASNLKDDLSRVKMEDDGLTPYARDITSSTWEWFVIQDHSSKVMKHGTWLSEFPPLIACTGERVVENSGPDDSDPKVHYYPLTRDAEEPQLIYTILENIILLRLGKSPYSKWKIAFESIINKQSKEYRDSAVTGEFDVLYKAYSESDKAIPPPEEMEPKVLDQVLLQLQQVQIQKIERILGIFDSSLGKSVGTDQSGKAIQELRVNADLSQYHFTFNFLESVRQFGIVTLSAMPHYLTAPQQLAFVDKDDTAVMQMINIPGGITFSPAEKYSLVIQVMPNSETSREAEGKALMDVAENPVLGPMVAQVPGAAAIIIKAQPGMWAQKLGALMEESANDPEKKKMAAQIQDLSGKVQQQGQVIQGHELDAKKYQLEIKDKEVKHSIEASKEINRHQEEVLRLGKDMTVDQAALWIEAFNADTQRMKVDGQPQSPESLDPERAARAVPA